MDLAEFQGHIAELEPKLERLRALYEQYFLGFERIPPNVLRKEVDRTLWQLRRVQTKNTRARFKLNQLVQRYNTYQQYWKRITRQIERGTYKRDVIRAARKVGRSEAMKVAGSHGKQLLHGVDDGPIPSGQQAPDAAGQTNDGTPDSTAPRSRRSYSPGRSNAPPARPTPARGQPRVEPGRARQLYDEYVRARRAAGQSTGSLTYDKLRSRLAQQAARLRQKHGPDRQVDFVVAMKNGKPVLRPIVK